MIRSPFFWRYCVMPGSLAGWIFAIAGIFAGFTEPVRTIWIAVLLIWTILHPMEIIVSYPIGREKNLSTPRIVLMTILFGFTWWLPLKLGFIER